MKRQAVVVDQLERCFDSFVAVDKVSFSVEEGKIFGFLGPNGAGKSTTIRMLCGILEPTSGKGSVGGYDIYKYRDKIKAHIGYMSQKFSLYQDLSVEENIDFYSGIYRVPDDLKEKRKAWVVEMASLKEQLHMKTGMLSGGWKQRLALGCAILHEPSILFLDEPTAGVDPINRRRFWDLIYSLSDKGVTVFVTTHYMDEAEYCDEIAFIDKGKLMATGTPEQLKQEVMSEEILEVTCQNPQERIDTIKALSVVKEVALFGYRLHVVVKNAEKALPVIKELFAQKEVKIEKVQPSLEDVFIFLTEKGEQ